MSLENGKYDFMNCTKINKGKSIIISIEPIKIKISFSLKRIQETPFRSLYKFGLVLYLTM